MARMVNIMTIIVIALVTCANGTTYYVGNDGNNSYPGTDPDFAWQTLGKACSTVVAGDTVLIMGGTWKEYHEAWNTNATLFPITNGTADNYIVFKAYPDSARPVIGSYGQDYINTGIQLLTKSYIIIDSLIVRKTSFGIFLAGTTDNIIIRNCRIDSTGHPDIVNENAAGIIFLPNTSPKTNVTVESCTLSYNNGRPGEATVNSAGILCYATSHSKFTNNVLYNYPEGRWGAIFVKGNSNTAIEISYNKIYDAQTSAIHLLGVDSCNVHHNVIYNCYQGIEVYTYWDGAYAEYNNIYNNTIIASQWGMGYNATSSHTAYKGCEWWNNIIFYGGFNTAPLVKSSNVTIVDDDKYLDYNCYYDAGSNIVARWGGSNYTLTQLISTIHIDSNSVNLNPVFADPANHDFHLTESSPDALKNEGRGGIYDSYMGAFPYGPRRINQIITKDSTSTTITLTDNLGGGIAPYDSLVLHWSQTRANVLNLSARDLIITDAPDPCIFYKTSLTPNTKYYFRILAYDEGAIGDTSGIDSVTTTLYDYINQVIVSSSNDTSATLVDYLSGGTDPYDSLILHWSRVRADVVNFTARDTLATSVTSPHVFSKASLDSNTTYYYRILAYDTGAVADTTEIDSVETSLISNWDIISVGVSESVSSTYPGYSDTVINNGVINPRGGTISTWASDENSSSPHWVLFDFSDTVLVAGMIAYWAWNNFSSSWMYSQQYRIQYWDDGSNSFIDIDTVNNSAVDSVTATWFFPVTTTRIRYYQPANMGPPTYPAIVWLTELEIYGDAGIPVPEPIGTNIIGDSLARVTAYPVNAQTAVFYEFALDVDSTYPNPRIEPPLVVDTVVSTTFGNLSYQYTYYWKIRAISTDLSDTSNWSRSMEFSLSSTETQSYSYAYPDSNEEIDSRYIRFTIIYDSFPNNVFIEIDRDANFSTPFSTMATEISQGSVSWEPVSSQDSANVRDVFRDSGLYYWRASTDGNSWITFPFRLALNSYAYPVPFRQSEGNSQITFTNLPENSRIVIATVSGATVLTETGIGPGDWIWDVRNEKGRELASGVYLYAVDSPGGISRGKIVVIR